MAGRRHPWMTFACSTLFLLAGCAAPPEDASEPVQEAPVEEPDTSPVVIRNTGALSGGVGDETIGRWVEVGASQGMDVSIPKNATLVIEMTYDAVGDIMLCARPLGETPDCYSQADSERPDAFYITLRPERGDQFIDVHADGVAGSVQYEIVASVFTTTPPDGYTALDA